MRLTYIALLLLLAALSLACSPPEEAVPADAAESTAAEGMIGSEDFESGDTNLLTSDEIESEEEDEGEEEGVED